MSTADFPDADERLDVASRSSSVLVVDDDELVRQLLSAMLAGQGLDVTVASSGQEALARCAEATPDLIVSDIEMPGMSGLELLQILRGDPRRRDIPVIMLTRRGEMADVVRGLRLGADDYVSKPFKVPELLARVQAKLDRPPVPADRIASDPQTGALAERVFLDELGRDLLRANRGGAPCVLASIVTSEIALLTEKLGARAEAQISAQLAEIVTASSKPPDLTGSDGAGQFLLLLVDAKQVLVQDRLDDLGRLIGDFTFDAGAERVRLTATIGFAPFEMGVSAAEMVRRAHLAADHSAMNLDQRASRYSAAMEIVDTPTANRSRRIFDERGNGCPTVTAWFKATRLFRILESSVGSSLPRACERSGTNACGGRKGGSRYR